MLAQVVAVANLAEDPFVKVRSIINDLITRLESEASDEATQKTFCDTNVAAAIQKRDDRKAEMETAGADIEATTAEMGEIQGQIATLEEEIAALHKAEQELIELRNEEKDANQKIITDADEGKTAVDQAIILLQNYYGTALLQRSAYVPPNSDREGNTVSDLAPETFNGTYSGKYAESKSVVGLLQVMSSDFDRTSVATAAAEAAAASAYQTQLGSIQNDISSKGSRLGTTETDLEGKKTDLVGFKDSLKTATELHDAALAELETLKVACVDGGVSWVERKAQRQREIEALKEALTILHEWRS